MRNSLFAVVFKAGNQGYQVLLLFTPAVPTRSAGKSPFRTRSYRRISGASRVNEPGKCSAVLSWAISDAYPCHVLVLPRVRPHGLTDGGARYLQPIALTPVAT